MVRSEALMIASLARESDNASAPDLTGQYT